MSVFIGGIVSIIVFYILILAVGIWAGKKQKSTEKNPDTEEIMLAGRDIGLAVGIFTMTGIYIAKKNQLKLTWYISNEWKQLGLAVGSLTDKNSGATQEAPLLNISNEWTKLYLFL